jgi:hypothetical protein
MSLVAVAALTMTGLFGFASPASATTQVYLGSSSTGGGSIAYGSTVTATVTPTVLSGSEVDPVSVQYTLPASATLTSYNDAGYTYTQVGNVITGTYAPPAPTTTLPSSSISYSTSAAPGATFTVSYKVSSADGGVVYGGITTQVMLIPASFTPSSSPNTAAPNTSVTFYVTGLPNDATGTVTYQYFNAAGAFVTACTGTAPSGACTFVDTMPPGSTTPVLARFHDLRYVASQRSFNQVTTKATVSLTATTDRATYTAGSGLVTFTETGLPGDAGGTVRVYNGADSATFCTISLPGSSCTTPVPAAGSFSYGYSYSGDTHYYGSSALSGTFHVMQTTAVTGSGTGTNFNNPITLTAGGVPSGATGTVTFADENGTTLCTATLPATSCTNPGNLPAGSHNLTVSYGGDGNYAAASATFPFAYGRGDTTVAGISSGNYSHGGTGTATTLFVTKLSSAATGTVTFTDQHGNQLCQAAAPAGSCSPDSNLPANVYRVDVTYSGDSNYNGTTVTAAANNDAADFTVNKAVIAPVPNVAPAVSTYGDTMTLTQTTPFPADATGTLYFSVFYKNGTFVDRQLCVTDIQTGTCTVSGVVPGSYTSLRVFYSGDSNYSGYGSYDGNNFTVNQASTTLTEPDVSGHVGQPITVTVAGLPAAATGTVTFADATGNLLCSTSAPTGSCDLPALTSVGTDTITATYNGDGNYTGSDTTFARTVTKRDVPITVSADAPRLSYGNADGLTVAGLPTDATGTVTMTDEPGNTLCTVTLPALNCTVAGDKLTVGDHTITATYSGDSTYTGSTASTTVTVTRSVTAVHGKVAKTPNTYGHTTVAVVSNLTKDATGTVTFTTPDRQTTTQCIAILPKLTCSFSTVLFAGLHTLHIRYSGDATHLPSTATSQFVITKAPVTATAAPTNPTVTAGGKVTLTMTGLPTKATGSIVFTDQNGNVLCTATLPATSCSAVDALSVGPHLITAHYSGDANYQPRTQVFTVTVDAATAGQPTTVPLTHAGEIFSGWLYYTLLAILAAGGSLLFLRHRRV